MRLAVARRPSVVRTAEESVAKGIRRVVGITGDRARAARETGKRLCERAEELKSRSTSQDIADELGRFQKEVSEAEMPVLDRATLRDTIAELQKIAKKQSKQQATVSAGAVKEVRQQLLDTAERVNGVAVVAGQLPDGTPVVQVREAADWLRTQAGSAAVVLGVVNDDKPLLLAALTEDVVKKGVKAGDLIKHIVPAIDGRGGGKPDMAQAGGAKPEGIPDALGAASQWLRQKLA